MNVGGTISAEHGIGKLKREYLRVLYGEQHLREMAALKRAFDPAGILDEEICLLKSTCQLSVVSCQWYLDSELGTLMWIQETNLKRS